LVEEKFPNIRIFNSILDPNFDDDVEEKILSPLSCLREFDTKWILEFDLPLVKKEDIIVSFDLRNAITVEAKLKETYVDSNRDYKHEFQYFKKRVFLPGNIDDKKISTNFTNGRLIIIIPKIFKGNKIRVE
jgi:HSP20 family protein